MQMGSTYISTEHLLLGIVREGSGTALEVLDALGVTGDDIRAQLNDMVSPSPVAAGKNFIESLMGIQAGVRTLEGALGSRMSTWQEEDHE